MAALVLTVEGETNIDCIVDLS